MRGQWRETDAKSHCEARKFIKGAMPAAADFYIVMMDWQHRLGTFCDMQQMGATERGLD
jgi:hypothetical protein